MANEYAQGYCHHEDECRKVERPRPNHLLHLLMFILTGGLWAIVWLGVSISFGGWRCSHCGSKDVTGVHR